MTDQLVHYQDAIADSYGPSLGELRDAIAERIDQVMRPNALECETELAMLELEQRAFFLELERRKVSGSPAEFWRSLMPLEPFLEPELARMLAPTRDRILAR